MMPLLAASGYRVESYDMAGQFESAAAGPEHRVPPDERYQMDLFTDDLLAVLETGPTPAHVLGYSFAGTVAGVLAVDRPDLFSSLTLLSAPPVPGQAFGGLKHIGWLARSASPRVATSVMLWGIRWNLTRVARSRQGFVRSRLRHTRRSSVRDIIELMTRTPDLRDALHASGIPMLVATGTGDLWSVEQHRAFADAINGRFVSYPTGHSPCETTPHQLVADMLQLFRQSDGAESPG